MLRDLREYFTKMQLDYNRMLEVAEKVNKEIEQGLVTEEQRDNFEAYFQTVKTNYDRVSYIMHLVSLPPKFIQKLQDKKMKKEYDKQMKELQKASLEAVHSENEEALNHAEEDLAAFTSEGD